MKLTATATWCAPAHRQRHSTSMPTPIPPRRLKSMSELRQSPLHAEHEKLGASFTAFGPWNMPLKYGKELDEHHAVRNAVGMFDLSHMGERSNMPTAFLSYALNSNTETVKNGKAKRSEEHTS